MVRWTEHASPGAERHLARSTGGGASASFDNAPGRLSSTCRAGRRDTVDAPKACRWNLLLASWVAVTWATDNITDARHQ